MSHIPQRKEKDCLNCGTIVEGRFCQNCGQENVVPKETFWHMFTHFFYDITHFDSNFFHTIHHLILKPGFLSKEYMIGRRASYLHPIRMYVFMSAIFFLLFFSFFSKGINIDTDINKPLTLRERENQIERLQEKLLKKPGDSALRSQLALVKDTSRVLIKKDILATGDQNTIFHFTDKKYATWLIYDSVQQQLPRSERDGWIMRRLIKKQIEIDKAFRQNPDEAAKNFINSLLHRLPYMLFVSLPLFALLLRLVYIRRKSFFYADHGVFTIHLYIFSFILLMLFFLVEKLQVITGLKDLDFLMFALFLLLLFYLYKAMRIFYGQGRLKTFIKFLLIALLSFIMMAILLILFMFFSVVIF